MAKEDIEKIIKGVKSEIKKEFKTQTGVLIEEFQHRVSAIGEQYSDIKKTLDEHTKTLDSHSNQIANLLMDSTEIKSDTRNIKLSVKLELDNKVDKKHFVDLEGRVRVLEKR